MSTCYLVHHDKWYIARPGAIKRFPVLCPTCFGARAHLKCPECDDTSLVGDNRIALAWFDRDSHAFICYDSDEPDVQELPDNDL